MTGAQTRTVRPGIVQNERGLFHQITVVTHRLSACFPNYFVNVSFRFVNFSPVNLRVIPQFDADKVKVSGPGVENTGVLASFPVEFIVDTTEAGDAELSIIITVSFGRGISKYTA